MIKKVLLTVLAFWGIIAHAETIFFKKDGLPISKQEHEIIYRIMLENQFPMSLMYGSYTPDEVKAMNERIKSKFPDIDARFFPTTLYELFALNFIREHADNIEQASNGVIEIESKKHKSIVSYFAHDIEPKEFKEINLKPGVVAFHFTINNYILDVLKKNNLAIPSTVNDSIKIVNTIDFWQLLRVSSGGFYKGSGSKNYLNPVDMKRAIEIEYEAHSKNKFVLYRGANVLDDEKDPLTSADNPISKRLNRSISFGSTLLGGIFSDVGACAYCYMSEFEQRPVGYALLIDKKEYAQGKLSNMFYIPPLITLLDLLAKGEFFHSRAKVPDLMKVDPLSFQKSVEYLVPFTSYYQIKAPTPEKAQEIYSDILRYIRDNHIILKKR